MLTFMGGPRDARFLVTKNSLTSNTVAYIHRVRSLTCLYCIIHIYMFHMEDNPAGWCGKREILGYFVALDSV